MTDLEQLIAAVEAGTFAQTDFSFGGWHPNVSYDDARGAFTGSLDAAKRLHDALLPGWAWMMGDKGTVTVIPPERLFAEKGIIGPTCRIEVNPARAWLLAILRAVQAKG